MKNTLGQKIKKGREELNTNKKMKKNKTMKDIEIKIRKLYYQGYKDGKKQNQTPYTYTADSDKGKELYDFIEKELEKAKLKGNIEGLDYVLCALGFRGLKVRRKKIIKI